MIKAGIEQRSVPAPRKGVIFFCLIFAQLNKQLDKEGVGYDKYR